MAWLWRHSAGLQPRDHRDGGPLRVRPLQSPPAESLLWSPADVAEEAVTPGRGGGEAGGEEGGVPPSLQGDQPHPTAVRTEALQVGGGHHPPPPVLIYAGRKVCA